MLLLILLRILGFLACAVLDIFEFNVVGMVFKTRCRPLIALIIAWTHLWLISSSLRILLLLLNCIFYELIPHLASHFFVLPFQYAFKIFLVILKLFDFLLQNILLALLVAWMRNLVKIFIFSRLISLQNCWFLSFYLVSCIWKVSARIF